MAKYPRSQAGNSPVAEEKQAQEVGLVAAPPSPEQEAFERRYGNLPLEEIRQQLSPEDYEIFMETVGAIELPLEWTLNGKHTLSEVDLEG